VVEVSPYSTIDVRDILVKPGLRERSFDSSSFAAFAALRETFFSTQRRKARQEIAKKKTNKSTSFALMRNLG